MIPELLVQVQQEVFLWDADPQPPEAIRLSETTQAGEPGDRSCAAKALPVDPTVVVRVQDKFPVVHLFVLTPSQGKKGVSK